ncbi:hypothetical protein Patl1_11522 [Pistacia atlantica]|uniref:Uncharacterized protein n=1 Tax=Pistacia atlantica TaxID=434234 RepID=A0ACC1A3G0_9ROSI|nr:hypothetical protein Patl1_11522 [Pistacia atlantica]
MLKATWGRVIDIDENGKTLYENGWRLGMIRPKDNRLMSDHVELTDKVSGSDSNLKVEKVKQKLELVGIICNDSCIPGLHNRLFCPQGFCGFSVKENLLSTGLDFTYCRDFAMWMGRPGTPFL